MVGFLRKKKSGKVLLSGETVLDRKGKVDGASLLDGDGEPTEGSLYDVNGHRIVRRASDDENCPANVKASAQNAGYPPVMATGTYPPQHSGYPQQYGYGGNQQPQQFGGYGGNQPQQYGNQPQQYNNQPQQYGQQPQQYGNQPQQYGNQQQYPTQTLGGQYQYPVRYGQVPPPMPAAAPKRSRFRIPGYGKKN